jgi:hypothetical protein
VRIVDGSRPRPAAPDERERVEFELMIRRVRGGQSARPG